MLSSNKLPFIYIPSYKLKLLIGTGSSNSFINPEVASKYFSKDIKNDPIVISTVYQENIVPQSIEIPAFNRFMIPYPLDIKFHILKFHEYFDGLIGFDILEKLQAKLDLVNSMLTTPHVSIQLHYTRNNQPPIISYDISVRSQKVIKLPVNQESGEIIIPYMKLQGCEIPETLTVSKDNFAITTINNSTDKPVKFDLIKPIRWHK